MPAKRLFPRWHAFRIQFKTLYFVFSIYKVKNSVQKLPRKTTVNTECRTLEITIKYSLLTIDLKEKLKILYQNISNII